VKIKLIKILMIGFLVAASVAHARNACSLVGANADKVVKLSGVPGYFYKVHPSGDFISFIEAEHNTLLDMNTGKEYPMVGHIDPVWSPDGKFLTHPGERENGSDKRSPLQFYDGDSVIEASLKGKPFSIKSQSSELAGVYQAIGVLENGNYRIISDRHNLSMGEYSYTPSKGPVLLSPIKKPCDNIPNFPTDLPILSKDGRFLSVQDKNAGPLKKLPDDPKAVEKVYSHEGSTKIYKIDGDKCELALDLERGTGKVAFNNHSTQIAFHVEQFSSGSNSEYFKGIGADKVLNVVVLNLEETKDGKLVPTSWALASHDLKPGDGGYYPDYDKDGYLYYMEDLDNNFQVVKVDPRRLDFRPMEKDLIFRKKHCVNCEGQKSSHSVTEILAKIWTKLCAVKKKLNPLMEREFVMAIDPKACTQMVNRFWVKSLGASKEELIAACPKSAATHPLVLGKWDPKQKNAAEVIIKSKCIACHSSPGMVEMEQEVRVRTGPDTSVSEKATIKKEMPVINLDKLDFRLTEKMMEMIKKKKMPKLDPLSDNDQKVVLNYLQKRQLMMPPMDVKVGNEYLTYDRFSDEQLAVKIKEYTEESKTPENVKFQTLKVMCEYGHRDCDKYLVIREAEFKRDAEKLPLDEREKSVKNKLMELNCSNLMTTTPEQCREWLRSKK
jgi:hypothetical protein